MTKKIFHSILLVAGTVLLASLLVIMGCLYEYFGSVEKKQLRDELELAAVAVEKNGTEYLSQLSSERYRLTWIENDGTVLYDTVTDAESLENHADRVEVKQALEYGEGESTRYSSTLLQKTMYCAERLADGSVLRISMSRATAGVLLVGMVQPILVVLIVALILSSVLAKSLSHRIVQPLNKLDLEHPLENDAYECVIEDVGKVRKEVESRSAWRIEGTLREFPKFASVNLWFKYPVHSIDNIGVLKDIAVDDGMPTWKKNFAKKKTDAERKTERKNSLETAFEACGIDDKVTVKAMAEYMGVTEKTVRNRLKEHGGFWIDGTSVGLKEPGSNG